MIFTLMCRVKIWKLSSQILRNDPVTLVDVKGRELKQKGIPWMLVALPFPCGFWIIPLNTSNTVFNEPWLFLPTGQIGPGIFYILSFQIQILLFPKSNSFIKSLLTSPFTNDMSQRLMFLNHTLSNCIMEVLLLTHRMWSVFSSI